MTEWLLRPRFSLLWLLIFILVTAVVEAVGRTNNWWPYSGVWPW